MARIMGNQVRATVCLLAAGLALGAAPRQTQAAFGPGDIVWTRTYDGAAHNNDQPAAMAVDSAGNSYITGYTRNDTSGDDIITIKYGPDGTQLWANTYNIFANIDDRGTGIAVDSAGDVFVCGWSGFQPNGQFTTIKYNAGGQQLWATQWPEHGNSVSGPNGIAVDDSGNCYVTGYSAESVGTVQLAVTIKYDGDGRQAWVSRYGEDNTLSQGRAIKVDAHRSVCICGTLTVRDTARMLIAKYDTGGHEKWVAAYEGPGRAGASAEFLAVDASGSVYVAGFSLTDSMPPASGMTILKFDSAGRQLWLQQYPGTYPVGLRLDPTGVYVAGIWTSGGPVLNYLAVKYAPDGTLLWTARHGEPAQVEFQASDMAVDDRGYVYLTGSGSSNGWVTARIAPGGRQDWHSDSSDTTSGGAVAIGLDDLRHIYVTGYSYGSATGCDITTMKYDSLPLGVEEVPRGYPAAAGDLLAFPNPAAGALNIRYSVPVSGLVSLNLYDAIGRLARCLFEGRARAGTMNCKLRTQNCAKGVYLLKLATAGGSVTSKLVVQ